MIKYAAFLRAINVGGKNLIKMDELKKIFEAIGLENVESYIQSGNILFESTIKDENSLVSKIENHLHKILSKDVLVFVRTVDELKEIVKYDPFQKLKFKVTTKFYITFLKEELKQKLELPYLSPKKDVEIIRIKNREIYCITQEKNGRYGFPNLFIENEFGVKTTTRNWTTVSKVIELI